METAQEHAVTVTVRRPDGAGLTEHDTTSLYDQLSVAGVPAGHFTVLRDGRAAFVTVGTGASEGAAVLDAVRRVELAAGEWVAVDGAEAVRAA